MAGMLLGAGISSIGSLIGSGKQASAIKDAANTQAQAADYAANLTSQSEANSLDFTKGVYGNAQGYEQPYQQAGTAALSSLSAGVAPGGEFNSNPTADQVLAEDPGYQFRLDQGQQALQRAEAAGGGVGSGGALKAAEQYGQNYASSEYSNAYNRFQTNRQNNFADVAGVAGLGQNANSTLTNAGTGAASNISNTSLQGSGQQGNDLMGAANATAAGGVGVANAEASNLSNIGTAFQQAVAANQTGYGGNTNASGGPYTAPQMGYVSPASWSSYDAGSVPSYQAQSPALDFTNLTEGV